MNYLKRLRARHWAWMNFLASIGIAWPLFMLLTPPELIAGALNPAVLAISMIVSLVGTGVALFGYFASQQRGKLGVIGVSIELSGLILSFIGPAAYLLIRLYLLTQPADPPNILSSPLFFAYSLCAVYLYRFVIVIPRFRFEARDPNKE